MAERHGFTQADLDRLQLVESADLSVDGERVVYARFETDAEAGKDRSSLWTITVENGAERRLTSGTARDMSPTFSPDGSQVAFLSTRAGAPQIFTIALDGGEARQVTSLRRGAGGPPVWSPDGTKIAFSAGSQEEPRDPAAPYRVTRAIYRFDGAGYLDDVKQDVYLVEAAGGEAHRLTDDAFMNVQPRWLADGSGLLYLSSFGPTSTAPWSAVRRVDLAGAVSDVPVPAGMLAAADLAPDGTLALLYSNLADRPIGRKAELYAGDVESGEFACRTRDFPWQVGGGVQPDLPASPVPSRIAFLPDGEAVLEAQRGGSVALYRIALRGAEEHTPLTHDERICTVLASAAGRVLFRAHDFSEPGDLYLLEGEQERRLTHLNAEVLDEVALPEPVHLEAKGEDGAAVEGWFLRPTLGSTAPRPTVLYIHGGPHSAFGHDFHADMQLLAGAGFGVLLANHRGSTGYGDAFGTAIQGDWGHLDFTDLMAIVDRAVAEGLADPDRLGVCGLSGGGNLTCWTVGHTDRFKAAVPENPVSNFHSMFGVQDMGIWFGAAEMGGAPHEVPDAYRRSSPITDAHRCTTPTLLVQGEGDLRCPPEQSEQFYNALVQAGCPVEMLRLPGSPHAGAIFGPLPIRRGQNEALVEWMERWLQPA